MPCYDGSGPSYSDNSYELRQIKERNDMLARIACRAMTELEKNGMEDFLLLSDEETREWWTAHKAWDAKRKAEEVEKLRKEQIKKEALAKLTAEEREVLGIKAPTSKKKAKVRTSASKTSDILDMIRSRQT
ncbi:hypothetical protein UFOVP190_148 [uncultured Caudovirales phage]|uniref:Uncharacterized protein n=1 Tax=uncultured Caudovirales phage TaxID=2100421 RepID=A0A6J7WJU5_9CAUD|nr:hypothetical protein UFOVP190_148 [uncultured Caudovirales phage]